MSHLRPEDKAARHRMSSCRRGIHNYGESQRVGAGIVRKVCLTCAGVTIDLTGVDEVSETTILERPNLASFRR